MCVSIHKIAQIADGFKFRSRQNTLISTHAVRIPVFCCLQSTFLRIERDYPGSAASSHQYVLSKKFSSSLEKLPLEMVLSLVLSIDSCTLPFCILPLQKFRYAIPTNKQINIKDQLTFWTIFGSALTSASVRFRTINASLREIRFPKTGAAASVASTPALRALFKA